MTLSLTVDTICSNQSYEVVANVVNGGENPQYRWYVNGFLVNTGDEKGNSVPLDAPI